MATIIVTADDDKVIALVRAFDCMKGVKEASIVDSDLATMEDVSMDVATELRRLENGSDPCCPLRELRERLERCCGETAPVYQDPDDVLARLQQACRRGHGSHLGVGSRPRQGETVRRNVERRGFGGISSCLCGWRRKIILSLFCPLS